MRAVCKKGRVMKRIILIFFVILLLFPVVGFAQDSKETLALKRDLAQERVMRITAELGLMKIQFREGQQALKDLQKELNGLTASLKAIEPKKDVK
jgi:hypothetical protein